MVARAIHHHGQRSGRPFVVDEIGELSLASQTRLLHVLQDKQIERLGGEGRRIRVDVRVIAATNRSLEQMVAEGTFRQDLFFRLNVIRLSIPPLRERPRDIPLLVNYFLQSYRQLHQTLVSELSTDAMDQTAREVCIEAFTASKGNCLAAAQLLGLHRNSVYRLIRRHGLDHLLEHHMRPQGSTHDAIL